MNSVSLQWASSLFRRRKAARRVFPSQFETKTTIPKRQDNLLFCSSLRSFSTSKTGEEHHAFFQEQLEELEKERKTFFGEEHHVEKQQSSDASHQLEQISTFYEEQVLEMGKERNELFGEIDSTPLDQDRPTDNLDKMHLERDALFDFTLKEKKAWGSFSTSGKVSSKRMLEIAEARNAVERGEDPLQQQAFVSLEEHHESFSHVSPDGALVHMVDVGHKDVTTRMAQAQAKVILPEEVLKAFSLSSKENELVGPKGPILATAKLAGIMAAKKTSDLIPLCHPLPLDQVKVDIRLQENEVIIDCTCRVTHKTGVEMEALMGASVAALTVYDMVKAVSHQVQITDTRLIAKTGGKRTV